MDFSRNVTLSGGLPSEYEPAEQLLSPPCSKLGSLDDLFSGKNTEGDMNLEWLSMFVEDCLSSSGNGLPPVAILPSQVAQNKTNISTASKIIPKAEPSKPLILVKSQKSPPSSSSSILQKLVIPGKARSKRKRGPTGNKAQRSTSAHHLQMSGSDPPLLQQAHWLADSELILPKNEENNNKSNRGIIRARNEETKEEANNVIMEKEEGRMGSLEGSNGQQPRRCSHCLVQRTPQWRAGPLGPKTLCNACGVRYKSGRLLPEYRPAKSPTFVSYKHSNSHKKVLEMRSTSFLASIS